MGQEDKLIMGLLAHRYAKTQGDEEYESSHEDYIEGYEAAFALLKGGIKPQIEYTQLDKVGKHVPLTKEMIEEYIKGIFKK